LPRLALVVTTHERPDALAAVLTSVERQRDPPDVVVIAEDGPRADTAELVAGFRRRSGIAVRHVWQEHRGFRVARLRNLAIAALTPADPDYLVFIDGDMLLHREFVADHRRFAQPGRFTQGVRVLADAASTRTLLAHPDTPLSPTSSGIGGLRRAYLLHSPAAAAATRVLANGLIAIKSCNFAAWRDDLQHVNGFDEAFEGWGPEDKELALRLSHAGVRRQTLLFGGIAIHLHHPAASREMLAANLERLENTRRQRLSRADRGLDSHLRT
jgi:GT2 family glycosyltransferase